MDLPINVVRMEFAQERAIQLVWKARSQKLKENVNPNYAIILVKHVPVLLQIN